MPVAPWVTFADVVLQQEAALCRIVAGVPPRDFAGLYVADAELEAALRTLPGLDGPPPAVAATVHGAFGPVLRAARTTLHAWLAAPGPVPAVAAEHAAFEGDAPDGDTFAATARRAGLGPDDVEVLALLAAVELDPQRQRVVTYVQDNVALPRLTLATLGRILGHAHAGQLAVEPGSPLRRAELVTVDDTGPWAVRMCGVPARVAWALRGGRAPDPALPPGTRILAPADDAAEPGTAPSVVPGELVAVHGVDRESRLRAARARYPRRPVLAVPGETDPTGQLSPAGAGGSQDEGGRPGHGWTAEQAAAVVREATLRGCAVVVELAGPPGYALRNRIESASHLPWVLTSAGELPLETLPDGHLVEIPLSDGEADDDDWRQQLGCRPVAGYRLTRQQLRLVAAAAGGDPRRLAHGVRRLAGGHLDGLAVRVRPRRNWHNLILPADQLAQLRELAVRHRLRSTVYGAWEFPEVPSTGVIALFAGPSGTGKTLAAEVIAADLQLDLYKVDLSSVVSKYIGETEKNLERIFDAAAAGDLVLFFDEADALFGKRSDVSDAHDRYANIEVAYLLQRLESYAGLVVLATNLQRNIDEAFLRRISVAVTFVAPDEEQRAAIWHGAFPAAAPTSGLDVPFLARRFKVTGGVIRNVALAAAFRAAAQDRPIGMDHVILALKREYGKLGRLINEAEFGPYFELVSQDEEPDDGPNRPDGGPNPGRGTG